MPRKPIETPDSREYEVAYALLRSKKKALELVTAYPSADYTEIKDLALERLHENYQQREDKRAYIESIMTGNMEKIPEYFYQARVMNMCGFPHRKSGEHFITRRVPLDSGDRKSVV